MARREQPASFEINSEQFALIHACLLDHQDQRLEGYGDLALKDVLGTHGKMRIRSGADQTLWYGTARLSDELGIARGTLYTHMHLQAAWGLLLSYAVVTVRGMHIHYIVSDHILGCHYRIEPLIPTVEQLLASSFAKRCYYCKTEEIVAVRPGKFCPAETGLVFAERRKPSNKPRKPKKQVAQLEVTSEQGGYSGRPDRGIPVDRTGVFRQTEQGYSGRPEQGVFRQTEQEVVRWTEQGLYGGLNTIYINDIDTYDIDAAAAAAAPDDQDSGSQEPTGSPDWQPAPTDPAINKVKAMPSATDQIVSDPPTIIHIEETPISILHPAEQRRTSHLHNDNVARQTPLPPELWELYAGPSGLIREPTRPQMQAVQQQLARGTPLVCLVAAAQISCLRKSGTSTSPHGLFMRILQDDHITKGCTGNHEEQADERTRSNRRPANAAERSERIAERARQQYAGLGKRG